MKKKVSVMLVILWMAFIFIMSSFNASESSNQSGIIVNIISNILNINNIHVLSTIVRKLAHFTEYLILSILVTNMISTYHKKAYLGLIICSIYAISDELHQILVPGRSCEIKDILIDITGAIIGIIIFNAISKKK